MRFLSIASSEGKIVQQGIKVILDETYEPKFLNCSFGLDLKEAVILPWNTSITNEEGSNDLLKLI